MTVIRRLLLVLLAAQPVLADDSRLSWALGQIETGASSPTRETADFRQGSQGEVSRYQILPKVWQRYGGPLDYTDPAAAWLVAKQILDERAQVFRTATGREPTPFDLYALWNAPNQYASVGYQPERLSPRVIDRATRFQNLALM